jgi:hypothetical protein
MGAVPSNEERRGTRPTGPLLGPLGHVPQSMVLRSKERTGLQAKGRPRRHPDPGTRTLGTCPLSLFGRCSGPGTCTSGTCPLSLSGYFLKVRLRVSPSRFSRPVLRIRSLPLRPALLRTLLGPGDMYLGYVSPFFIRIFPKSTTPSFSVALLSVASKNSLPAGPRGPGESDGCHYRQNERRPIEFPAESVYIPLNILTIRS